MLRIDGHQQPRGYTKDLTNRVKDGSLKRITLFKGEFGWLSNYYWHYRMPYTVEHHFQAAKASGDCAVMFRRIMDADSPGKAKRLGRLARLPKHWPSYRDVVMKKALVEKFDLSPMKEWLLATGDIPLEEGNFWHDNYWGNCYCRSCESTPGNNNLGKLLMEVRSELRERDTEIHQERIDQTRKLREDVLAEQEYIDQRSKGE